jgi:putative ATPase
LFGPPGCGKSTLALIIAKQWPLKYCRVSAPETSLSQLRKLLQEYDLLILDEIHRFTKTQQDFFLPFLETGRLRLLATTTENPSFSITNQLLSRLHVLRLFSLTEADLSQLAQKATLELNVSLDQETLDLLVRYCSGDARILYNLIEYVTNLPGDQREANRLSAILPELLQKSDRNGDQHYHLASALIKSIRGSDPDAALYYLTGMLEGGEDPRFICRRLIISAAEDIGLADPQAMPLAVSCAQAVELIGMPEGAIPLAETTTYLALAPKSNSTYAAFRAAQHEIKKQGLKPVPLHLRNPSSSLSREWGYGQDYKYPHSFPGSWIKQEYLPPGLQTKQFYFPKDQGQEQKINLWLKQKLAQSVRSSSFSKKSDKDH